MWSIYEQLDGWGDSSRVWSQLMNTWEFISAFQFRALLEQEKGLTLWLSSATKTRDFNFIKMKGGLQLLNLFI